MATVLEAYPDMNKDKDMTMDDLRGIITAAVHLHDEDRSLPRWTAEVQYAEHKLENASPVEISRMCKDLAIVRDQMKHAFTMSCDIHAAIRERKKNGTNIPGGAEIIQEQDVDATRQSATLLDLRSRLRALDGQIIHTLVALRDQGIDARLTRLARKFEDEMTLDQIAEAVQKDHDQIGDAFGAWKDMHTKEASFVIVSWTGLKSLSAALRRMEQSGAAVRRQTILSGTRWTFPKSSPAAKAA